MRIAGVYGSVIAGGGAVNYNTLPYTNSVSGDFSFLGGGAAHRHLELQDAGSVEPSPMGNKFYRLHKP